MANIVLVNPSANMLILSKYLQLQKNDITFVNDIEIPVATPSRIYYFFDKMYTSFDVSAVDSFIEDSRTLLFKKSFFSGFKMLGVSSELRRINQKLSSGDLKDCILFKQKSITKLDDKIMIITQHKSLDEIISTYHNSHIFTAMSKGGDTHLTIWNTDYDFRSVFGRDYFVFFINNIKCSVYAYGNSLITLTKHKDALQLLTSVMPTLKQYSFTVVKTFTVSENHTPYLNYKQIGRNTLLLNDYSFGSTSVKMSQIYYERLATAITNNINKK